MQIQISIPQWLSIDQKVRLKLVEVFELPRTGYTHVQDGVVTTDGYKHEDLAHLTVAKMQDYINNHKEEVFFKLLDRTLNQVTRQVRGDEILNDGKPPAPPAVAKLTIEIDGQWYTLTPTDKPSKDNTKLAMTAASITPSTKTSPNATKVVKRGRPFGAKTQNRNVQKAG